MLDRSTQQKPKSPLEPTVKRPEPRAVRGRRGILKAIVVSLVTCIVLGALGLVPLINHDVKRLFGIPTELSGPHTAAEVNGADRPIPGSTDFILCALSRTPAPSGTSCEVSKRNDGWHIVSSNPDESEACAALCIK